MIKSTVSDLFLASGFSSLGNFDLVLLVVVLPKPLLCTPSCVMSRSYVFHVSFTYDHDTLRRVKDEFWEYQNYLWASPKGNPFRML